MCIPNGKRSFAANQATKYGPNFDKQDEIECLVFLYRKEYLAKTTDKFLLELLLMYSKVLFSSTFYIKKVNKLVLCYNFLFIYKLAVEVSSKEYKIAD